MCRLQQQRPTVHSAPRAITAAKGQFTLLSAQMAHIVLQVRRQRQHARRQTIVRLEQRPRQPALLPTSAQQALISTRSVTTTTIVRLRKLPRQPVLRDKWERETQTTRIRPQDVCLAQEASTRMIPFWAHARTAQPVTSALRAQHRQNQQTLTPRRAEFAQQVPTVRQAVTRRRSAVLAHTTLQLVAPRHAILALMDRTPQLKVLLFAQAVHQLQ